MIHINPLKISNIAKFNDFKRYEDLSGAKTLISPTPPHVPSFPSCTLFEFLLFLFNHVIIFLRKIYFKFIYFCFLFLFCIVNMFILCFSVFLFLSATQYLQMKWPLLDVQTGSLQSRQTLKDARSPSPAHIVVSNTR